MDRTPNLSPSAEPAVIEQEALRIQAAAVAAQQMAMLDAEWQLEQRRTTLDRQERQLAQHLESQRRQLDDQRKALEAAARDLAAERAAMAQTLEAARDQQAAAEADLQQRAQAARAELDAQSTALRKQQADLQAREARLDRAREELEASRTAHRTARLRFNGEIELARRQLEHQWAELAAAAQASEELRAREDEAASARAQALDQREAALAETVASLRAEQQAWTAQREQLALECAGLETRIANLRAVLSTVEPPPTAPLTAPPTAARTAGSTAAAPPPAVPAPRLLCRLAEDLQDQRRVLAEHWQHLLEAEQRWQQERTQTTAALDQAATRLAEREAALDQRQGQLESNAASLAGRQAELQHARELLAARSVRLAAAEAGWTAERDRLLVELQSRSDALTQLRGQLTRLRQVWRARRAKERATHQAALDRLRAAQRRYADLWREERQRRRHAGREQRALATQAIALEQLRHELILHAPDAAAAERRFARLLRREVAIRERDERELLRSQDELQGESRRLEELARLLGAGESDLLARQEALEQQRADLEERALALAATEKKFQVEEQNWRARLALDQRLLAELRDELERITHFLLSADEVESPAARAA